MRTHQCTLIALCTVVGDPDWDDRSKFSFLLLTSACRIVSSGNKLTDGKTISFQGHHFVHHFFNLDWDFTEVVSLFLNHVELIIFQILPFTWNLNLNETLESNINCPQILVDDLRPFVVISLVYVFLEQFNGPVLLKNAAQTLECRLHYVVDSLSQINFLCNVFCIN